MAAASIALPMPTSAGNHMPMQSTVKSPIQAFVTRPIFKTKQTARRSGVNKHGIQFSIHPVAAHEHGYGAHCYRDDDQDDQDEQDEQSDGDGDAHIEQDEQSNQSNQDDMEDDDDDDLEDDDDDLEDDDDDLEPGAAAPGAAAPGADQQDRDVQFKYRGMMTDTPVVLMPKFTWFSIDIDNHNKDDTRGVIRVYLDPEEYGTSVEKPFYCGVLGNAKSNDRKDQKKKKESTSMHIRCLKRGLDEGLPSNCLFFTNHHALPDGEKVRIQFTPLVGIGDAGGEEERPERAFDVTFTLKPLPMSQSEKNAIIAADAAADAVSAAAAAAAAVAEE
jgi:hypothetical protein